MNAVTHRGVLAEWCSTANAIGPEAVVLLRDGSTGVSAIVVVDNTASAPASGDAHGRRRHRGRGGAAGARDDLKSAAAGLPHGGAKAGIVADPLMSDREKEAGDPVVRSGHRRPARLHTGAGHGYRRALHGMESTTRSGRSVGPGSAGRHTARPARRYGVRVRPSPPRPAAAAGSSSCAACASPSKASVRCGTHAARFLAERGACVVGGRATSAAPSPTRPGFRRRAHRVEASRGKPRRVR